MSSTSAVRTLAYRNHRNAPDARDDLQLLVSRRLTEVRQMIRPHRLVRHPWQDFSPELQELIEKFQKVSSRDFLKQRRHLRRARGSHFKSTVQFIVTLLRAFGNTKRYYENEFDGLSIRSQLLTNSNKSQISRASISTSLQHCLTTLPNYRDTDIVKQIQGFLKVTGAFKHLFPMELEPELARYLEFSRYESGRILAYQARPADCLYYVLTGKINKVCQFSLSKDDIVQRVGVLRKGQTNNVEEFVNQWPRQSNLIAEGHLEVLILHRRIYSYLQQAAAGLPMTFLRSLTYLERFDFAKLGEKPQMIQYRCCRRNEIIASDTNRTPWLYIIKAGTVNVVRCQKVIDFRKLQRREKENASRKLSRTSLSATFLERGSGNESRKCRSENGGAFSSRRPKKHTDLDFDIETGNQLLHSLICEDSTVSTSTISCGELNTDSYETSIPRRTTFVALDCLKSGDIFGLDRLRPPLASDPKGLTLLSDGAEVIQISKSFFLKNVDENILYTSDTLCKEYLTEHQVEEQLLNDASWELYKQITFQEASEKGSKLHVRSARN